MIDQTLWFIGIFIAVAYFGGAILDRLPKPKRHNDFTFESVDDHVVFRIDTVIEKDFSVTFVEEWKTGRSFSLHGPVINGGEARPEGPNFRERTGVSIYLTSNWFKQSQIGRIKVYERGGAESFVGLPYQIARHVLEDVRRNPHQVVTIGFKKVAGKGDKPAFAIYSFELSDRRP